MESKTIKKKSYTETNEIARSPTLQTVIMVEKFIKDNSGEYKKTELFNNLPKKVMWQTFQVIMEYLENTLRVVYDKEGYIVYIWNPEFYNKYADRKDFYTSLANAAQDVNNTTEYQEYIISYQEFENDSSEEAAIARKATETMQAKMREWAELPPLDTN